MSYLKLEKGIPNFSKGVISLWFRAPESSIRAAARAGTGAGEVSPLMRQILPLLTFGPLVKGYTVKQESIGEGTYTSTIIAISEETGTTFISSETLPYGLGFDYVEDKEDVSIPGSYIGLYCNEDEDTGELTVELRIRIQSAGFGTGAWVYTANRTSVGDRTANVGTAGPVDTAFDYVDMTCHDGLVAGTGPWVVDNSFVDASEINLRANGPDVFQAGDSIIVEPDKWHHLLLSFDLTNTPVATGGTINDAYWCGWPPVRTEDMVRAVSGPCSMWIAVDDKNYDNNGKTIEGFPTSYLRTSPYAIQPIGGLGTNGVATDNHYYTAAFAYTGSYDPPEYSWAATGLTEQFTVFASGMPTYTSTPGPIPTSNNEFGFPASTQLVNEIYQVEMGEFQLFTGVTLDTGIESNRRAFIDYERDQDGKIILDKDGKATLKPVAMTKAEELLGKKPEIKLHGSSKWINGKNTGTTGVDYSKDPPEEKPDGQFQRVAEIVKYKPDPSLVKVP